MGLFWIGNVRQLYNRPCYDDITKIITARVVTHALVIGTPGIGKTLFLQAFLVHLARQARKDGRDVPSIHYLYERGKYDIARLSFLPDGSVVDISGMKGLPRPDYVLSDSVYISMTNAKILTVLVASDQETNYNTFLKRVDEAGEAGEVCLVPLFSFDELRAIRPDMNIRISTFRNDVFGGSARRFVGTKRRSMSVLPIVYDVLTEVFPDIKSDYPNEWTQVATEITGQLTFKGSRKGVPGSLSNAGIEAVVNSMMIHRSNGTTIWASKFMEWLASAMYDERTPTIYNELKRIFGSGGYGNAFESTGHRRLIKSTLPFRLKPLLDLSSKNISKPEFGSAAFNLPLVRFKVVSEIGDLPDGTYGLAMDTNLGGCDAIIQPNTLIEFTTTPKKHKASLEMISKIRAQLHGDPSDHRIIFVIPLENVKTFMYHADLANIQQLSAWTNLQSSVRNSS